MDCSHCPRGPAYRVLVLPELSTMRPRLFRKIRDLVSAGATVLRSAAVEFAELAELSGLRPGSARYWPRRCGETNGQDSFSVGEHPPGKAV